MSILETLAKEGIALPDGSFPILSADDVLIALRDIDQAEDREEAMAHIIRRASELGVEMDDEEVEDEEVLEGEVPWEGILAVEGFKTNDGRYLMPGEIGFRELPLPLMMQTVTADGHMGAEIAGRIEKTWKKKNKEYGDDAAEIWASGVFSDDENGHEAARLVRKRTLRGVSIDLDATDYVMLDSDTLEEIDPDTMELEDMLFGDFVTGMKGNIMGATITPFPAIEHASIEVITAAGKIEHFVVQFPQAEISILGTEALTAAARGMAPLLPPTDWFYMPEANQPTPLTVTPDGRVFGHLAIWDTCHTGINGVCRMAPRSRTNYAWFHLGQIETAEGDMVNVGKLTVDCPHAPTVATLTPERVRAHYDDTGTCAAFVRAVDGRHGIWLSGAVRSDAPAEVVRDLRAHPPSGDWRGEGGALELQAALCVNVPGFPVPRYEVALVASGDANGEIAAMIQTGYVEAPLSPRATRLRRAVLIKQANRLLAA